MTSWQDIQQGAKPFIDATRYLELAASAGMQQLQGKSGKQFWMHTMIPTIVMKAFSCELMLKAILRHESIDFGKIHFLNTLYDLLSSSPQATPQSKAIYESIKVDVISEMGDGYDEARYNHDFDDAANLFVDWRYFFEESTSSGKQLTAPITFLDRLFQELEKQKNALS